MINLLPPDLKDAYRYAHRNVRLSRWVVAFAFSFIGLVAISTGGLVYMHQQLPSYNKQITGAQTSLGQEHLAQTQYQVTDINGNLKLAAQVLSKEILFSKLLQQLATAMPNDTVLTGLTDNQAQGGVSITAQASNYTSATQIQVNLTAQTGSNAIFSSADIESINCSTAAVTAGSVAAQYPCAVTIQAVFPAKNPFLFINSSGA